MNEKEIDEQFLNERFWRVCECGLEIARYSQRFSEEKKWMFVCQRVRHGPLDMDSGEVCRIETLPDGTIIKRYRDCELRSVIVEPGPYEDQRKIVLALVRQERRKKKGEKNERKNRVRV